MAFYVVLHNADTSVQMRIQNYWSFVLISYTYSAAKADKQAERGWSMSNYGVSKLGLIALTRIQGQAVTKDTSRQDVLVNSVSMIPIVEYQTWN